LNAGPFVLTRAYIFILVFWSNAEGLSKKLIILNRKTKTVWISNLLHRLPNIRTGEPSRDNEGQQDGLVNKGVWVFCFVFWFLWFFETGFLCVALAVLELTL
jgi:hypothetical protein